MTQHKEELTNKISVIPDDKLTALKPLIDMLYIDTIFVENIEFDDLTDDEEESVIKGRIEYNNGECIDFEDYLNKRN